LQGKLPHETLTESYLLEYGEAAIEIHRDAIGKGERVLIFDDLLATGGTAAASIALVNKLGGKVVEASFIMELNSLKGRDKLNGTSIFSLIQYD
jgi:adenine phosphoribosyltransferase